MPGKRTSDERKFKLIKAVGDTLTEKGYEAFGLNKIAASAGVSKPMIYEYFGSLNRLLKAYIAGKDSWMPYLETLQLPEHPTSEELKNCFITMLQDQFRFFHQEKEMRRLVHWQIRSYNPLMRATCEAREREGARILKLADDHFRKSGISLKAVMAMLVGGIYHNVLHDTAGLGTMAGIDLKNDKDLDIMLKTIAQIVEWAFNAAAKEN
ncbi:TetR/AcrR family transcriptional regulator [Mucilaginibacter sp. BT774]|uniref:TetR/AcrR family transcriptional regulator n=1 Tax=Mucilaginibacter sp. BT774 TaxID=3062276 RepID=UPI00267643C0|nr:TetR/AcrR family transcriptional regulator [Mucilaginibacter sp. BT774]MDO3628572.1 TetR/AcrR family transcriptional regulator [Mucilaginibacter sp. BT774]